MKLNNITELSEAKDKITEAKPKQSGKITERAKASEAIVYKNVYDNRLTKLFESGYFFSRSNFKIISIILILSLSLIIFTNPVLADECSNQCARTYSGATGGCGTVATRYPIDVSCPGNTKCYCDVDPCNSYCVQQRGFAKGQCSNSCNAPSLSDPRTANSRISQASDPTRCTGAFEGKACCCIPDEYLQVPWVWVSDAKCTPPTAGTNVYTIEIGGMWGGGTTLRVRSPGQTESSIFPTGDRILSGGFFKRIHVPRSIVERTPENTVQIDFDVFGGGGYETYRFSQNIASGVPAGYSMQTETVTCEKPQELVPVERYEVQEGTPSEIEIQDVQCDFPDNIEAASKWSLVDLEEDSWVEVGRQDGLGVECKLDDPNNSCPFGTFCDPNEDPPVCKLEKKPRRDSEIIRAQAEAGVPIEVVKVQKACPKDTVAIDPSGECRVPCQSNAKCVAQYGSGSSCKEVNKYQSEEKVTICDVPKQPRAQCTIRFAKAQTFYGVEVVGESGVEVRRIQVGGSNPLFSENMPNNGRLPVDGDEDFDSTYRLWVIEAGVLKQKLTIPLTPISRDGIYPKGNTLKLEFWWGPDEKTKFQLNEINPFPDAIFASIDITPGRSVVQGEDITIIGNVTRKNYQYFLEDSKTVCRYWYDTGCKLKEDWDAYPVLLPPWLQRFVNTKVGVGGIPIPVLLDVEKDAGTFGKVLLAVSQGIIGFFDTSILTLAIDGPEKLRQKIRVEKDQTYIQSVRTIIGAGIGAEIGLSLAANDPDVTGFFATIGVVAGGAIGGATLANLPGVSNVIDKVLDMFLSFDTSDEAKTAALVWAATSGFTRAFCGGFGLTGPFADFPQDSKLQSILGPPCKQGAYVYAYLSLWPTVEFSILPINDTKSVPLGYRPKKYYGDELGDEGAFGPLTQCATISKEEVILTNAMIWGMLGKVSGIVQEGFDSYFDFLENQRNSYYRTFDTIESCLNGPGLGASVPEGKIDELKAKCNDPDGKQFGCIVMESEGAVIKGSNTDSFEQIEGAPREAQDQFAGSVNCKPKGEKCVKFVEGLANKAPGTPCVRKVAGQRTSSNSVCVPADEDCPAGTEKITNINQAKRIKYVSTGQDCTEDEKKAASDSQSINDKKYVTDDKLGDVKIEECEAGTFVCSKTGQKLRCDLTQLRTEAQINQQRAAAQATSDRDCGKCFNAENIYCQKKPADPNNVKKEEIFADSSPDAICVTPGEEGALEAQGFRCFHKEVPIGTSANWCVFKRRLQSESETREAGAEALAGVKGLNLFTTCEDCIEFGFHWNPNRANQCLAKGQNGYTSSAGGISDPQQCGQFGPQPGACVLEGGAFYQPGQTATITIGAQSIICTCQNTEFYTITKQGQLQKCDINAIPLPTAQPSVVPPAVAPQPSGGAPPTVSLGTAAAIPQGVCSATTGDNKQYVGTCSGGCVDSDKLKLTQGTCKSGQICCGTPPAAPPQPITNLPDGTGIYKVGNDYYAVDNLGRSWVRDPDGRWTRVDSAQLAKILPTATQSIATVQAGQVQPTSSATLPVALGTTLVQPLQPMPSTPTKPTTQPPAPPEPKKQHGESCIAGGRTGVCAYFSPASKADCPSRFYLGQGGCNTGLGCCSAPKEGEGCTIAEILGGKNYESGTCKQVSQCADKHVYGSCFGAQDVVECCAKLKSGVTGTPIPQPSPAPSPVPSPVSTPLATGPRLQEADTSCSYSQNVGVIICRGRALDDDAAIVKFIFQYSDLGKSEETDIDKNENEYTASHTTNPAKHLPSFTVKIWAVDNKDRASQAKTISFSGTTSSSTAPSPLSAPAPSTTGNPRLQEADSTCGFIFTDNAGLICKGLALDDDAQVTKFFFRYSDLGLVEVPAEKIGQANEYRASHTTNTEKHSQSFTVDIWALDNKDRASTHVTRSLTKPTTTPTAAKVTEGGLKLSGVENPNIIYNSLAPNNFEFGSASVGVVHAQGFEPPPIPSQGLLAGLQGYIWYRKYKERLVDPKTSHTFWGRVQELKPGFNKEGRPGKECPKTDPAYPGGYAAPGKPRKQTLGAEEIIKAGDEPFYFESGSYHTDGNPLQLVGIELGASRGHPVFITIRELVDRKPSNLTLNACGGDPLREGDLVVLCKTACNARATICKDQAQSDQDRERCTRIERDCEQCADSKGPCERIEVATNENGQFKFNFRAPAPTVIFTLSYPDGSPVSNCKGKGPCKELDKIVDPSGAIKFEFDNSPVLLSIHDENGNVISICETTGDNSFNDKCEKIPVPLKDTGEIARIPPSPNVIVSNSAADKTVFLNFTKPDGSVILKACNVDRDPENKFEEDCGKVPFRVQQNGQLDQVPRMKPLIVNISEKTPAGNLQIIKACLRAKTDPKAPVAFDEECKDKPVEIKLKDKAFSIEYPVKPKKDYVVTAEPGPGSVSVQGQQSFEIKPHPIPDVGIEQKTKCGESGQEIRYLVTINNSKKNVERPPTTFVLTLNTSTQGVQGNIDFGISSIDPTQCKKDIEEGKQNACAEYLSIGPVEVTLGADEGEIIEVVSRIPIEGEHKLTLTLTDKDNRFGIEEKREMTHIVAKRLPPDAEIIPPQSSGTTDIRIENKNSILIKNNNRVGCEAKPYYFAVARPATPNPWRSRIEVGGKTLAQVNWTATIKSQNSTTAVLGITAALDIADITIPPFKPEFDYPIFFFVTETPPSSFSNARGHNIAVDSELVYAMDTPEFGTGTLTIYRKSDRNKLSTTDIPEAGAIVLDNNALYYKSGRKILCSATSVIQQGSLGNNLVVDNVAVDHLGRVGDFLYWSDTSNRKLYKLGGVSGGCPASPRNAPTSDQAEMSNVFVKGMATGAKTNYIYYIKHVDNDAEKAEIWLRRGAFDLKIYPTATSVARAAHAFALAVEEGDCPIGGSCQADIYVGYNNTAYGRIEKIKVTTHEEGTEVKLDKIDNPEIMAIENERPILSLAIDNQFAYWSANGAVTVGPKNPLADSIPLSYKYNVPDPNVRVTPDIIAASPGKTREFQVKIENTAVIPMTYNLFVELDQPTSTSLILKEGQNEAVNTGITIASLDGRFSYENANLAGRQLAMTLSGLSLCETNNDGSYNDTCENVPVTVNATGGLSYRIRGWDVILSEASTPINDITLAAASEVNLNLTIKPSIGTERKDYQFKVTAKGPDFNLQGEDLAIFQVGIHDSPDLVIMPTTSVQVLPGQSANFTVTVTNKDDLIFGTGEFNLSTNVPANFLTATLGNESLTIEPGQSVSTTLTISANENAFDGYYETNVTVSFGDTPKTVGKAKIKIIVCGNGVCDVEKNENKNSCPIDCPEEQWDRFIGTYKNPFGLLEVDNYTDTGVTFDPGFSNQVRDLPLREFRVCARGSSSQQCFAATSNQCNLDGDCIADGSTGFNALARCTTDRTGVYYLAARGLSGDVLISPNYTYSCPPYGTDEIRSIISYWERWLSLHCQGPQSSLARYTSGAIPCQPTKVDCNNPASVAEFIAQEKARCTPVWETGCRDINSHINFLNDVINPSTISLSRTRDARETNTKINDRLEFEVLAKCEAISTLTIQTVIPPGAPITGGVVGLVKSSLPIFGIGIAHAQAAATPTSVRIFENVSTYVRVKNELDDNQFIYTQCFVKDPANLPIVLNSSCVQINQGETFLHNFSFIVNKPGIWTIANCSTYGHPSDCKFATEQFTFATPTTFNVEAEDVDVNFEKIDGVPPHQGQVVGTAIRPGNPNVTIKATISGSYQSFQVAYTKATCENALVTDKFIIRGPGSGTSTSIWDWQTNNASQARYGEGEYRICLYGKGFENDRIVETNVTLNNYDFEFNPISDERNVISGASAAFVFAFRNKGLPDSFTVTARTESGTGTWTTRVDTALSTASITMQTGQERNVAINVTVPTGLAIGTAGKLKINVTGRDRSQTLEYDLNVASRLNTGPQITNIANTPSQPIEFSQINFAADIRDPENDKIKEAKVCRDQACTSVTCAMTNVSLRWSCNSYPNLPAGDYKFYVRAEDEFGLGATAEKSVTLRPQGAVRIVAPPGGSIVNGKVDVRVEITGISPPVSFSWSNSSDSCQGGSVKAMALDQTTGFYNYQWDTSNTLNGNYFICASASGQTRSVQVSVDSAKPRTDVNATPPSCGGSLPDGYLSCIDTNACTSSNFPTCTTVSVLGLGPQTGCSAGKICCQVKEVNCPSQCGVRFTNPECKYINGTKYTILAQVGWAGGESINVFTGGKSKSYSQRSVTHQEEVEGSGTVLLVGTVNQLGQIGCSNQTTVTCPIVLPNGTVVQLPQFAMSPRNDEKLSVLNCRASSFVLGEDPTNACDKDLKTSWSSDVDFGLPQIIRLDLGEVQKIDGVGILSVLAQPLDFGIQTSRDDVTFFTVAEVKNAMYEENWHTERFASIDARYLQLNMTASRSGYVSVNEIEVYKTRAQLAPVSEAGLAGIPIVLVIVGVIAAAIAVVVIFFREELILRMKYYFGQ